MLPSNPSPQSGFTLLEMLVSLAILAAILGITVTALRPPSPKLRLDQASAQLANDAALARTRAIHDVKTVTFALPQCDGSDAMTRFYPDGTALPATACLRIKNLVQHIEIKPLTGLLQVIQP
ncbi:hypothetical protein TRP8649_00110 [Pelagimonas phthalicica]|uniref:Prepilin-type N-terminal cleavage/methylation domain-containing protein n=1 Tax=Pelagimonas phthalicica TaxID=1037362 RepID=A0A238J5W1_9RHOB|nr:prepilin-type N-terminal cleavage/methylation domain-containing protein [Pelagimonas phthalicica]TDS95439.1 prepilin-type N-terminal cleavage/methylation domain-containing protein [Pelagimonas phthalicica]SMX26038.1 hypothetical protein TRP8649_00110 [Pelagimonas phthalicica]